MYASVGYFKASFPNTNLDEVTIEKLLKKASRDVDILTFNRIVRRRFENLTLFQQDVIKEVVCEHASFLSENESMIETYLAAYAINGVSMQFGNSWNLRVEGGVAIKSSLYSYLMTTGLCVRSFRG